MFAAWHVDYGVIVVPDATYAGYGRFGWDSIDSDQLAGMTATICGYPLQLGGGTHQYAHDRGLQLRSSEPHRLYYDVDTSEGQSGSPIWGATKELGRVAVGIHVYGPDNDINWGIRITDSIKQWLRERAARDPAAYAQALRTR